MDPAESIVRQYSQEIFGYLCRFMGDRSNAEDVLGDVFVKLIEQIKKVNDPGFPWRAWLYRVATNRAISYGRKKKLRNFLFLEEEKIESNGHSPEKLAELSEEGLRIKKAIETLNHKLKSVLILRIYQEMSYEEIAQALKINIGTVKSRINEARQRVKTILEEEK